MDRAGLTWRGSQGGRGRGVMTSLAERVSKARQLSAKLASSPCLSPTAYICLEVRVPDWAA